MIRFFEKNTFTLRKEIVVVVIIKLIAIFTIWMICFSDPVKRHLTTQSMQQRILGDNK